jgi:hypothetical protein
MLKKILMAVLLLGLIGGAIGIYFYTKPARVISHMPADLNINADSLMIAYEANEKDANTKYLNKVIEIAGEVSKIEENQNKQKVIMLDAPSSMMGGYVSVTMDTLDKKNYDNIKIGDAIKLKGLCTGFTMDVVINGGSVAKSEE